MGTISPSQSYDHVMEPIGGYSGMHDLQRTAEFGTETIERGAVMTIKASSGKFIAGTSDATAMPCFAISGTSEFDTNSDVGNVSGGRITGLVGTGGFEILTTEFASGSYTYNTLLTYGVDGDAGKVAPVAQKYSAAPIIGCVSRPVALDTYKKSVLGFWTMFIPTVTALS